MEGEVVASRPTGYTFDLTIRIFFIFIIQYLQWGRGDLNLRCLHWKNQEMTVELQALVINKKNIYLKIFFVRKVCGCHSLEVAR